MLDLNQANTYTTDIQSDIDIDELIKALDEMAEGTLENSDLSNDPLVVSSKD
jgi:hypothetical protein